MNAEIYTGRNSIENWLITQRTSGSAARDFTRKSDPNRIVVDDKSTMSAVKDIKYLSDSVTSYDSSKYEDLGGLIGAAAFAGIYALTYPVTLLMARYHSWMQRGLLEWLDSCEAVMLLAAKQALGLINTSILRSEAEWPSGPEDKGGANDRRMREVLLPPPS